MTQNKKFILRAYGLVINDKQEILLSDEFEVGMKMTKFPGGGLEFGEGIVEALKREFREECGGQEISNVLHFYTTDFFQKAMFFENAQLICVYYLADLVPPIRFKISEKTFDFEIGGPITQSFRWVKIKDLKEDEITFPIDKFVAGKLKQMFNA